MFNVGDKLECVDPVARLVKGQIYTMAGRRPSGCIELVGFPGQGFFDARFILAASTGADTGAGTPAPIEYAEFEREVVKALTSPDPLPEPVKELTPEDKLREYRKSLRKMIGI